ncbi:hypothetical protein FA13DRAFT_128852 [Coprinellus micaceus]|uniref:Uncharacterized protein n=1 Tax=Coprinellus micaceus TaxID=71717 RepID=A0A4Y7SHV3_COPMI|nr:hypothetical protein FA13DRAFT_128852 [Coprinellus micaceus]
MGMRCPSLIVDLEATLDLIGRSKASMHGVTMRGAALKPHTSPRAFIIPAWRRGMFFIVTYAPILLTTPHHASSRLRDGVYACGTCIS